MDAPQDVPRDGYPGDWRGERWRRLQYDRLYVRSSDGVPIGWFDLVSGDVHAVEPSLQHTLLAFLNDWVTGPEAARISPLPRLQGSRRAPERPRAEGRPARGLHLRSQPPAERPVRQDRSPGSGTSGDPVSSDGGEQPQPQPRRRFYRLPGTRRDR